jgi:hypothetical protein
VSIAGSKTSPAIYCINIIAMNPVRIDTPTSLSLRDRSIAIIAAAVVLALLYVGRDVLIPLVVAIMLSLLLTLLVRALRRVGLARPPSVFLAVLALTVTCLAGALVLGTQVLRTAQSIPQYQATVQRKLQVVDAVTEGRLTLLTRQAAHFNQSSRRDRGYQRTCRSGRSDVGSRPAASSAIAARPTGRPAIPVHWETCFICLGISSSHWHRAAGTHLRVARA